MASHPAILAQIANLNRGIQRQQSHLENLQGTLLILEKDHPEYRNLQEEIKLVEGNIELIRNVILQNEERLKR